METAKVLEFEIGLNFKKSKVELPKWLLSTIAG